MPVGVQRPRRPVVRDISLTEALGEALDSVIKENAGNMVDFYEWSLGVPEPKAGKLDFGRFPPQLELYKETAHLKDMVIMKSTQVGISAFLVRWSMYWPDTRKVNSLYVFPRARQMQDFAAGRVNPAIAGSPRLSNRVRDVDNLGMKRIGLGMLYMRGSEHVQQLDSVDADVLALDEYDTLAEKHIPDAERRISGSTLALIRRVGVPTYPDTKIAKLYNESDQRRWFVRCGACGERQTIDFFENVVPEYQYSNGEIRSARVCRRCEDSIEGAIAGGEWVAEYNERDLRGYHFSRLIIPVTNLPEIIKASKEQAANKRQVFFNKDLGLPYAPEEGRLSEAALEAATSAGGGYMTQAGYQGDNLVTAGIDMATTRPLTVRVSEHLAGGRKRALFLGELQGTTTETLLVELADLMRRFGVHMAAIDHAPDGRLSRTFAEQHAGRVYLVNYAGSDTAPIIAVKEEERKATVKRTDVIDGMMALIRAQKNLLPANQPETYRAELKALLRVTETDDEGIKSSTRYISTGADDYAHAETYDLVATMLWAYRQRLDFATAETEQPLDQLVDFERANFRSDERETAEYDPGLDLGDEYNPGFGGYE